MKDEPSWARALERGYHAVRRALRVVTRPVRWDRGGLEGVVVQPFRGHGTIDGLYLIGRVFRQPGWGAGLPDGSLIGELADLLRRVARWGLADATVTVRFDGARVEVETDRDGYFELDLEPTEPPASREPGGLPEGAPSLPGAPRRSFGSCRNLHDVRLPCTMEHLRGPRGVFYG